MAGTVIVSSGKRTLTTDADGTFSTRLEPGTYDLASMHFVAESATEDLDEFGASREEVLAVVEHDDSWAR